MTEKQLIAKIRTLRQIEPSKDWVVLTKKRILSKEKSSFTFIPFFKELHKGEKFIFRYKPLFATALVGAVLIGLFGFAQRSLPGDALFSIKKIAEKSQAVFISKKNQPKHDLEIVNKRLDDLTKIAEANQTQKLAPAIKEYQESISQAAESLGKAESETVQEIVEEVKKLEEKSEKIKALGIEIGENTELDNVLANIVEREIESLEERVLSEEKQEILAKVKEDYESGNYYEALENILLLLNQE